MIETLFSHLPEWAKSKLLIRMTYTAGSFITARIVGFLTGDYLNNVLAVAMAAMEKVGIHAVLKITSVDKQTLETCVTGALMICGEFLIQKFHDNHVVPVVAPAEQAAAKAQQAVEVQPKPQ